MFQHTNQIQKHNKPLRTHSEIRVETKHCSGIFINVPIWKKRLLCRFSTRGNAAVHQRLYPNEIQDQVSRPLWFKRLQTQENPSKHFSSVAQ